LQVSADDDSLHPRQHRGPRHILDEKDEPVALYATGAGHVDLARAMDPGLGYDIYKEQYLGYLCSTFGDKTMQAVTRNSSGMCSDHEAVPQEQLNYPSIVVNLLQQQLVVRTLTNLHADDQPEVYKVAVARAGQRGARSRNLGGRGLIHDFFSMCSHISTFLTSEAQYFRTILENIDGPA
jgi:hypothetical protein